MKVQKFWFRADHLTPHLQTGIDKKLELKLRQLRRETLELLKQERFVSFARQPKLLFDNQLHCLWLLHGFQASPGDMFKYVSRLRVHAFNHWEMPSADALQSICQEPIFLNHPKFQNATLLSGTPAHGQPGYRTVTLGGQGQGVATESQSIIPVHRVSQRDIFSFIVAHSLLPTGIEDVTKKLSHLYALTLELTKKQKQPPPPSLPALEKHLLEGDYIRARLPVLEEAYLYDMEKGLWELHPPKKAPGTGWVEVTLDQKPWEARNPEQDVREGVVAIDFGTSSTVVASREHGKTVLLRVGMTDFFRKPLPKDYQNPTILEFINLPSLLAAWNLDAYRPLTKWEDFHFSHEALANFRENEADQRIVAGILTNIKQWPLVTASYPHPLRITDQSTGTDLEICPVNTPAPVQGQRLRTSQNDPFDPIELYAYYLGLFINHRSNGLFLEYYMTFPVTYPKNVKIRILSSFARGLMRSLPLSLVDSPAMDRFLVREEASEPAAYAACALEELEIPLTPLGTAYAVFDFGGGSTDFDFGLLRLPSPEESQKGYERVLNHFGASGDMFLGGENLVAHVAYLTFLQNLEICREHKIPFSCPPEGEKFPGHELFIDHSHVAQTNSALLMAKVRHLWENFQWNLEEPLAGAGQADAATSETTAIPRRRTDHISDALSQAVIDTDFNLIPTTRSFSEAENSLDLGLDLLSRNREKVPITFKVDQNQINHFLVKRVGKGIYRFFIAMRKAFDEKGLQPECVHILQAGNASRALLVQAIFTALLQNKMLKWNPPSGGLKKNVALEEIKKTIIFPHFVVHRPMVEDPENPYSPTAKTGVAIGLLKLIPGESTLTIGPSMADLHGEAPFHLFVGRLQKGFFQPVIHQNGPYREWQELGVPTRGSFNLVCSDSPQAGQGNLKRGSLELREKSLLFAPGSDGKKLFAQAVGPRSVEICLADSLVQILNTPEEVMYQKTLIL